ncbi:hypothetical protein KLP40_02795 [Hymenobacter sp. NST-14]|uniref:hypothetical protein n=1 Tax=Hymenobacter piscis TaxID=2839984 RepID=UPI001C022223|nr:hypothetical protein [Hymenobacter piscis]MBT9392081.1 hypothetical protein [Hymenobacter piscis]
MQTDRSPQPINQSSAPNDELLTQPTTYHGAPAVDLLTTEEAAGCCRLYLARNDVHAPTLIQGDFMVCRPVARDQWASIAPDSLALLLMQYEAAEDGSWEPFQAHHVSRIVGNDPRGGGLLVLHDDPESMYDPAQTAAADLVEVYQITRTIRPIQASTIDSLYELDPIFAGQDANDPTTGAYIYSKAGELFQRIQEGTLTDKEASAEMRRLNALLKDSRKAVTTKRAEVKAGSRQ